MIFYNCQCLLYYSCCMYSLTFAMMCYPMTIDHHSYSLVTELQTRDREGASHRQLLVFIQSAGYAGHFLRLVIFFKLLDSIPCLFIRQSISLSVHNKKLAYTFNYDIYYLVYTTQLNRQPQQLKQNHLHKQHQLLKKTPVTQTISVT